jgi:hypothetical protein
MCVVGSSFEVFFEDFLGGASQISPIASSWLVERCAPLRATTKSCLVRG